jgi:hypothetical protein
MLVDLVTIANGALGKSLRPMHPYSANEAKTSLNANIGALMSSVKDIKAHGEKIIPDPGTMTPFCSCNRVWLCGKG